MGVIIRSAWKTIARTNSSSESRFARLYPERVLTRSLALLVYALKGCLPELGDVRRLTVIVIILFFYKVFYKEKQKKNKHFPLSIKFSNFRKNFTTSLEKRL
jgi:hypothetical protein